jgi:hypothetical protein
MMTERPFIQFPIISKEDGGSVSPWTEGSEDTPVPWVDGYSDSESDSGDIDSDVSEGGFRPTFEKVGDAIPRQSVFLARAQSLIQAADAFEEDLVARGKAIIECMTFILRPEYAPFHRAYPRWREVANERSAAFLAEAEEPELRSLCRAFMTKFPK